VSRFCKVVVRRELNGLIMVPSKIRKKFGSFNSIGVCNNDIYLSIHCFFISLYKFSFDNINKIFNKKKLIMIFAKTFTTN